MTIWIQNKDTHVLFNWMVLFNFSFCYSSSLFSFQIFSNEKFRLFSHTNNQNVQGITVNSLPITLKLIRFISSHRQIENFKAIQKHVTFFCSLQLIFCLFWIYFMVKYRFALTKRIPKTSKRKTKSQREKSKVFGELFNRIFRNIYFSLGLN